MGWGFCGLCHFNLISIKLLTTLFSSPDTLETYMKVMFRWEGKRVCSCFRYCFVLWDDCFCNREEVRFWGWMK